MADSKGKFDELVAPHLTRLFRVACNLLGNHADARDLVQDTCVAACESLDQLAASEHPLRWLLRVQHNRFIDGARRRRSAPVIQMDVRARTARLSSEAPGPEEQLLQADSEGELERAFQKLDETQRALLSLRAEGYSLAEIEAVTGISREVLRSRLQRARNRLAQNLEAMAGAPQRAPRLGSGS